MHQYRVELRVGDGSIKSIDVMAYDHAQAKMRAERQTNLVALSTQFIA